MEKDCKMITEQEQFNIIGGAIHSSMERGLDYSVPENPGYPVYNLAILEKYLMPYI